jgi:two-component system, NtrC family, response regulator AtoC
MTPEIKNTVLVGEDELEVRLYLEMALRCLGYSVELAEDGQEVISCLGSGTSKFAAVLLDLMMPCSDGFEILRSIRALDPNLPVIIVSGASSTLNVVTAMKSGATDFLCKPLEHEDLRKALKKAIEEGTPRSYPTLFPAAVSKTGVFRGEGARMREIQSHVRKIGWSQMPVLIEGETGTGKEVLARDLHLNSPRAEKVFLKLNCAALPSELLESELFGYERGAFTGAVQKKIGMFEAADGGTLLLDEIGDMDIRLQAKLLHVLQDCEFYRIGAKEPIRVDVRLIAATHRDLEKSIAAGLFRADLYYRLNVINVQMPPLRERKDEIIPLAQHLLIKHARPDLPAPVLTPRLQDALTNYQWPGNIRELENLMRNFVVFRNPDSLAARLQSASKAPVPKVTEIPPPPNDRVAAPPLKPDFVGPIERGKALEEAGKAKQRAETEAILSALNATHWNRKQAATLLQVDYKVLLYRMKRLGIAGKFGASVQRPNPDPPADPVRTSAPNEPWDPLSKAARTTHAGA